MKTNLGLIQYTQNYSRMLEILSLKTLSWEMYAVSDVEQASDAAGDVFRTKPGREIKEEHNKA